MKSLRYMIVFPVLLIVVSVAEGWYHYDRVKADMVSDLNQALERVVASSATVDGVLETLPLLQGGTMLTLGGEHTDFARQLQIPALRDTAFIACCLGGGHGRTEDSAARQAARICSDTIMLARHTEEGMDIAVTVKAYANPTLASIFSHSGSGRPVVLFAAGLLTLGLMLVAQRMAMKSQFLPVSVDACPQVSSSACVSAIMPRVLNLTPMQEQLLELFYASPSRTLSREDICAALWPKKDNPEDGLYTFISRMKSTLASQSSLRIVNRRGREYVLVDETGGNAC